MRTSHWLLAAILAAGIGGGLALGRWMDGRAGGPGVSPLVTPPRNPEQAQESFADVAQAVVPSVVHITREGVEASWIPWRAEEVRSVGSGVIVSADGDILTNRHVVEGEETRRILVKTYDGMTYPAHVVGMDDETDVAVLRVDAEHAPFTPARLGDSDAVRVGDWVLAIGSPFELNHTVTAGIVSAKGRRADLTVYEDYIQTDAAINPGNSGGALVNTRGEVIGITTAILAPRGTYTGIGYAIPIRLASWVKDQLLAQHEVRRGYLGVQLKDVNEALVRAMEGTDIRSLEDLLRDLGLERPEGAYVAVVAPDGPAGEAGIREGDVIVEYNGREIRGSSDLMLRVAETAPGTRATLGIVRDRRRQTAEATLGRRPRAPRNP